MDLFPYSALFGSTVGTLLSVYEGLGLVSVAAQCLGLCGTYYASVTWCFWSDSEENCWYSAVTVPRRILEPLVSDSRLFVASPEEYMIWIFWEMTSGIFRIEHSLVRQRIHALASVYEAFGTFSHDFPREVDSGRRLHDCLRIQR